MWLSSARFYTRKAKGNFWNLGGGPWPLWPPLNPPLTHTHTHTDDDDDNDDDNIYRANRYFCVV